jgi:hypothetical protein
MRIDIANLEFIDAKLRQICLEVERHFRVEFTITSLYRIGDTGVHGALPLRGIDFGCNESVGLLAASYVNSQYTYDPNRPDMECALYHDVGQGPHLHLQVHPNTE